MRLNLARVAPVPVFAVLLFVVSCGSSDPAIQITDSQAIEQVRRYLFTTPIEGEEGNLSCLALVEREGPLSVQWNVSEAEGANLRVDVRRGGVQLRDFAWMLDTKTGTVTAESAIC